MVIGIVVGVVGIAIVCVNYPLYLRLIRAGKDKYGSAILMLLNKDQDK